MSLSIARTGLSTLEEFEARVDTIEIKIAEAGDLYESFITLYDESISQDYDTLKSRIDQIETQGHRVQQAAQIVIDFATQTIVPSRPNENEQYLDEWENNIHCIKFHVKTAENYLTLVNNSISELSSIIHKKQQ